MANTSAESTARPSASWVPSRRRRQDLKPSPRKLGAGEPRRLVPRRRGSIYCSLRKLRSPDQLPDNVTDATHRVDQRFAAGVKLAAQMGHGQFDHIGPPAEIVL